MRGILIWILGMGVGAGLAFSQTFTWEINGIPYEQEGWRPFQPWIGGYRYTAPEFVDIDNDGDLDLFVGDAGFYIKFFENIGYNDSCNFIYRPNLFDILCTVGPATSPDPTFIDIDNDGDQDAFLFTNGEHVYFFENEGTPFSPEFSLVTNNFLINPFNGIGKGDFVDIDNDGDFDIIASIFLYPFDWKIYLYQNHGDVNNYLFDSPPILILDSFSEIHSKLSCIDIDNDNDNDLFIGTESGEIYFYRNDGDSANYNFVYVTDNFANASVPEECVPVFCDIDNDNDYDLFCGMEFSEGIYTSGDISFYRNDGAAQVYNFVKITDNFLCFDICDWCYPYFVDIDNDGDFDLVPGRDADNFPWIRNEGTLEEPYFVWHQFPFIDSAPTDIGSIPAYGDLDADCDYDLIIGHATIQNWGLSLFENTGTPEEPNIICSQYAFLSGFEFAPFPFLIDIDNDGDLDLFVGTNVAYSGVLFLYENTGTPERAIFTYVTNNYQNINLSFYISPTFVDYDNDGDYDLFATDDGYGIHYFENIGSFYFASYQFITDNFGGINDFRPYIFLCDIDNDEDNDIFVGGYNCGGIKFYRNNGTGVVGNRNKVSLSAFALNPCYPNPFNPTTRVSFTLNKALPIRLFVYNQLGQCVSAIADCQAVPGSYQCTGNAEKFSSGIYYISLETQDQKQTQKVILLK